MSAGYSEGAEWAEGMKGMVQPGEADSKKASATPEREGWGSGATRVEEKASWAVHLRPPG